MSCILSVEQMKEMDRASVEDLGLAALCLMENAGRGCADLLARRIEEWNCSWPAILCGTGNNGGDGYVIARMLANRGIDCTIFALGKPAGLSPETAANRAIVEKMGLELVPVTNPAELPDLREFDLLIDCVLGTGLKGAARTLTGALIGLINDSGVPVVAIDIPSGVQGDTGLALGPAVIARETLTMAAPKRGLVLQPGRELSGPWTTVDIGYDTGLFEGGEEWQWLTPAALAHALPRRHSAFHKGLAGHVLVIAGSTGLTGAAMLASQAAQRSGAGLVRLALPASLNAICESALPEIMTLPLPDAGRGFLGPDALDALAESLEWAQAVVLGPGLGRDPGTQELVIRLIASCTKPLVLDADALVAAAGNIEVLAENDSPRVITPHPGELARLLGQEKPLAHHALVEAAADLAGELDLTVILKGGPTVILGADRSVRVNSTGNHGMATGGTGDVLAGLLGGLLAQGCDPDEAPALAVWLHGRAGDLAAKRQGARSMGAIDLLGKLSRAFRELEALS